MGSQNRAHLSSNSKMVHIESPCGLHVQSTDPCKIVSQSPSGLVLPWRKINFLTVLEAKSKIEEPANSAPVKTDSLPGLQTATFSLCPHVAEKANSGLSLLLFSLVPPYSLWNLSSPTRDQTWALGSEQWRVLTMGPPGNPLVSLFL